MYKQIESNKRRSVLLIFLFILIITLVGWAVGEITDYGYGILVLALVISVVMSLAGYFGGDKMALAVSGAKGIKKEDNPYVYRMVENISITAGQPTPKVYLINDTGMNAFATGRKPDKSSIALTTGLVNGLENEELEGVIAHEMSHVKNYDIRMMTLVGVLAGTIVLVSDIFLRGMFFGGRRRSNNKTHPAILIIGLAFIILSPIIAQIIKLAVSRKREFLADADGALLTRYPEGLARALEKISHSPKPLEKANNATAHLYIVSPFGGKAGKGLAKMFSTHPPVAERVRALRGMA
ncbi:M48 family metallopeptidase [Candidatus Falkowbacteria bacterium]|nr:M48 family metallopeptidase [Candidatus Falkowbacteria bacterium]